MKITKSINRLLEPMRQRRADYLEHPGTVDEILIAGTKRARKEAKETMREVRDAMSLDYFTSK